MDSADGADSPGMSWHPTHCRLSISLSLVGWIGEAFALLTEQPQKASSLIQFWAPSIGSIILGPRSHWQSASSYPNSSPSFASSPLVHFTLPDISHGAAAAMALPIRCAPELQDLSLWRQHATQLRELYLAQNKTLKQVKSSMEKEHGWPEFK